MIIYKAENNVENDNSLKSNFHWKKDSRIAVLKIKIIELVLEVTVLPI